MQITLPFVQFMHVAHAQVCRCGKLGRVETRYRKNVRPNTVRMCDRYRKNVRPKSAKSIDR